MPCVEYESKRFRPDTLRLINLVNDIIEEYSGQGYSLTLRQVYYQLVARGYIPNNDKQYRIIGNAVNDGRVAGLIDWNAIEDRTRRIRRRSHWDSPADIINSSRWSYYKDHWLVQDAYVEVWVEKDALIGVVEQACRKWDTPCFSCRGYTSQSEMWSASQRFIAKQDEEKYNILIHLGDHDPSGIDMTRDIKERLEFFGAHVQVNRIALNRDQVDKYKSPPNPAKITDSRASGYIKKHGKISWELDALPPNDLEKLIEDEILNYLDTDLWRDVEDEILHGERQLKALVDNWDKVLTYKFMKVVK